MTGPPASTVAPARTTGGLTSGLALAVGIIAVSTSGPVIAYAAAPALAIAFWRNALALPLLVPAAALRRRGELRALFGPGRREGLWCVLAGLALAGHFMAWVPSTKMTSIAASIALVATQPVWVGLIAVASGRRLPGWTWLGIAAAVAGAIAVTGVDFTASRTALLGDLLALLGGALGAVYTVLGARVRATMSTTTYTTVCYATCAAAVLVVCLALRVPLVGFPALAWAAIVAVTIGPQLLGHSLFSFALRRFSATMVSVLILLEVPGAALLAWVWLGQVPALAALPGLVLLIAGVAIVALKDRRPAAVDTSTTVDGQTPTASALTAQSRSASAASVARGPAGRGRPST